MNNEDDMLAAWAIPIPAKSKRKPTKSQRRQPNPHNIPVKRKNKAQSVHHKHNAHSQFQTKAYRTPPNHSSHPQIHGHTHRHPSHTHNPQIDSGFAWLKAPYPSKVLSPSEIKDILAHAHLKGQPRMIAIARRHVMQPYLNCAMSRQWAGLCQFDSDKRLEQGILKLTSFRKTVTAKLLYYFNNGSDSSEDQSERSDFVNSAKRLQLLLNEWHDLIGDIRQRQRAAKESKLKMNGTNGSAHPTNGHSHKVSNGVSNGSVSGKQWWDFGKRNDVWNTDINPEFMTLYRGHVLDDCDYDMCVDLWRREAEGDSGEDCAMNRNGNDAISVLGPAMNKPPGIDAVKTFRRKTNDHKSRLISNLKLLYGSDNTDMVSDNGIYRAHLLSEYTILSRVGSGVYGCVFKAKTKRTHKLVAIKTLQLLLNSKQRESVDAKQQRLKTMAPSHVNTLCPYMMIEGTPVPVIREIMSLKQLNHINITQLYDLALNDPFHFNQSVGGMGRQSEQEWNFHLVQEFVPNELYAIMKNLKQMHLDSNRNRNNPLFRGVTNVDKMDEKTMPKDPNWFSCAQIKSIMKGLLEGLKYLKSESYIHRDLKPSNILLTDDGIVKIADFGLSRPKYKENELLTNAHNVVTRYYRAPEILIEQNKRRSSYSFASDMWSIGAIFAELICGRPIFRGHNDIEQIYYIMHKCGSITEQAWHGISHTLTHDPPADFCKIDPITGQKRDWNEGKAKYNFLRNMRVDGRNKARKINGFLTPFMNKSWSKDNRTLGLALINEMLCYDPRKRVTPEQALAHKWFEMTPPPLLPRAIIKKSKSGKGSQSHTDLQKEQRECAVKKERHKIEKERLRKEQTLPVPMNRNNCNINNYQRRGNGGYNNGYNNPQRRNGNGYNNQNINNGMNHNRFNNNPNQRRNNGYNNQSSNGYHNNAVQFRQNARREYLNSGNNNPNQNQNQNGNNKRVYHNHQNNGPNKKRRMN